MSQKIEDYAILGNCETLGLVGRNGSIDWLGFPRFDSPACFASLLGNEENGRWLIAPKGACSSIRRSYREQTLVLETEFETDEGAVVLVDCMERHAEHSEVLRLVRGLRGRVEMKMELTLRFDYGSVAPWVTRLPDGRLRAVAGADQVIIDSQVPTEGRGLSTVAEFSVGPGQEIGFSLCWARSWGSVPKSPDVGLAIEHTREFWRKWSAKCQYEGPWSEAVLRSLITLKALSHHATGGIVAAGTTSLPEQIGGSRNWDYRFCWLRDATFTLYALMSSGFHEEAKAWRDWLIRAVAGSPEKMQILYSVAGERRLPEYEIAWLPGYEQSRPVRIGNAAAEQVQLDVYGEVIDMMYQARRSGLAHVEAGWSLERALLETLETMWQEPDEGIWEVRGGPRHFTHSKVMAWAALDRAVQTIERYGAPGPLDRYRALRARIHEEVCERGYNPRIQSFVQSFDSNRVDASLLLLPLVGFLPPEDPRIKGTVAAIERELVRDGFVMRYITDEEAVDGIKEPEGVFLACSFWLADNYVLQGEKKKARELFERLLTLRNDVGLLAEEYDPLERRQTGNFPQAFSHVALINTAHNLSPDRGPAQHRSRRSKHAAESP